MAKVKEITEVVIDGAEYDKAFAAAKLPYIRAALEALRANDHDIQVEGDLTPAVTQILPVNDPNTGLPIPKQVRVLFVGQETPLEIQPEWLPGEQPETNIDLIG